MCHIIFSEQCKVKGALRLTGGVTDREGSIEVCLDGSWGTICHEDWDNNDARVVCSQLGYPRVGKNWYNHCLWT